MSFLTQNVSGIPMWAAIAVSVFNPGTLLCTVVFFPKRWFTAHTDDERRTLKEYGKYDPDLHGVIMD